MSEAPPSTRPGGENAVNADALLAATSAASATSTTTPTNVTLVEVTNVSGDTSATALLNATSSASATLNAESMQSDAKQTLNALYDRYPDVPDPAAQVPIAQQINNAGTLPLPPSVQDLQKRLAAARANLDRLVQGGVDRGVLVPQPTPDSDPVETKQAEVKAGEILNNVQSDALIRFGKRPASNFSSVRLTDARVMNDVIASSNLAASFLSPSNMLTSQQSDPSDMSRADRLFAITKASNLLASTQSASFQGGLSAPAAGGMRGGRPVRPRGKAAAASAPPGPVPAPAARAPGPGPVPAPAPPAIPSHIPLIGRHFLLPPISFGSGLPPDTAPHDESLLQLTWYVDSAGQRVQRTIVRNMMAPDETRVLTTTSYLDPGTNGVRSKDRTIRGVVQGDTVYRNFKVEQDLVMANTAVDSAFNTTLGVAMLTKGEDVESNTLDFATAFAGSLSVMFRGFTSTDELYTAEPGHRFGLDFGAAAVETGRTDGLQRCVPIHRRANGWKGFASSYFTALSTGVRGYKVHAILDY